MRFHFTRMYKGETSYIKYFWFKVVDLYLEILIILDEEMRRSDQLLSQMMPKSVSDKVYKYQMQNNRIF